MSLQEGLDDIYGPLLTLAEFLNRNAEPPSTKDADCIAWNAYFERAVCSKYAKSSLPFEQKPGSDWAWRTADITELNQTIARLVKEIMREEGLLIANAIQSLVYDDMEADWTALDIEKRKEFVVEGLYRGACAVSSNTSRLLCPEMTVDGLISDGEYSVINLLKRIVEHDPSGNRRVKKIFLFAHPRAESETRCREESPDLLKAWLYRAVLVRNYYIVAALTGILEAYNNIDPFTIISVCVSDRLRNDDRTQDDRILRKGLKSLDLKALSQVKEEPPSQYACYSCYTPTNDRTTLKRCSRCKLTWYCSSICQTRDWKAHKKTCGKTNFDPALVAADPEDPDDFIGCPAVVPGFVRTPALWQQIWYLSKPDSVDTDYHVNLAPTTTAHIVIPDPRFRLVFLVARRRAMASGSPPAVYTMLNIVEDAQMRGFFDRDLTLEKIRRQFETEYRISTTEAGRRGANEYAPPTEQEIAEEWSYLQRRIKLAKGGSGGV
ncbi:hypothetical protein DFH09DRAFT_1214709 [Mycena vulgaris]|nr:hypothetical protein DFH09DRAFT_1214709 [Mycena vulgaris]